MPDFDKMTKEEIIEYFDTLISRYTKGYIPPRTTVVVHDTLIGSDTPGSQTMDYFLYDRGYRPFDECTICVHCLKVGKDCTCLI